MRLLRKIKWLSLTMSAAHEKVKLIHTHRYDGATDVMKIWLERWSSPFEHSITWRPCWFSKYIITQYFFTRPQFFLPIPNRRNRSKLYQYLTHRILVLCLDVAARSTCRRMTSLNETRFALRRILPVNRSDCEGISIGGGVIVKLRTWSWNIWGSRKKQQNQQMRKNHA